jgi:hypothetical protein
MHRINQEGLIEGAHVARANAISRQTRVSVPYQTVVAGTTLEGYPINRTVPTPELSAAQEEMGLRQTNQRADFDAAQIAHANEIARQTGIERPFETVVVGYDRRLPISQTRPTAELQR